MKKHWPLFALLGLIVFSSSAFAFLPNNTYLGGGLGSFSFGGTDIGKAYAPGVLLFFSGELENLFLENFSLKSTLGYYTMAHTDNSKNKITIYPWTLTAKYSLSDLISLGSDLVPYVGAGITNYAAYITLDGDDLYAGEANFGGHIVLGLDLKLSDELKGSFELIEHFVTINKGIFKDKMENFGSTVFAFGVQYNLTPAKAEKPAEKPAPKEEAPIVQPLPQPVKPILSDLEIVKLRERLNKINLQIPKDEAQISKLKWRLENEKMTPQTRAAVIEQLNYHESVVARLSAERAEILKKLQ